jgi:hypothetical protein
MRSRTTEGTMSRLLEGTFLFRMLETTATKKRGTKVTHDMDREDAFSTRGFEHQFFPLNMDIHLEAKGCIRYARPLFEIVHVSEADKDNIGSHILQGLHKVWCK